MRPFGGQGCAYFQTISRNLFPGDLLKSLLIDEAIGIFRFNFDPFFAANLHAG